MAKLFFSGIAGGSDSNYVYDDVSFTDSNEKYKTTVVTAGLGVEWAWTAKNPSLPPLFWSLELGLGYGTKDYDNASIKNENKSFLAAGASIHYMFE